MNRSFISVIAGGFGQEVVVSDGDEEQGNTCKHQIKMGWICWRTLSQLSSPRVRHGTKLNTQCMKLLKKLRAQGINVRFGIHPVAGRLLAAANVIVGWRSTKWCRSWNGRNQWWLTETDTVLVIGANDTVNPAALEDPNSPIAGMLYSLKFGTLKTLSCSNVDEYRLCWCKPIVLWREYSDVVRWCEEKLLKHSRTSINRNYSAVKTKEPYELLFWF